MEEQAQLGDQGPLGYQAQLERPDSQEVVAPPDSLEEGGPLDHAAHLDQQALSGEWEEADPAVQQEAEVQLEKRVSQEVWDP